MEVLFELPTSYAKVLKAETEHELINLCFSLRREKKITSVFREECNVSIYYDEEEIIFSGNSDFIKTLYFKTIERMKQELE